MATWTIPMYTAASPGNLLPKFSGPAVGGTIARRASLLQKSTGAAEIVACRDLAGAEPTNPVAPISATSAAISHLAFIAAPFGTRPPRRRAAAGVPPSGPPPRRHGRKRPRT